MEEAEDGELLRENQVYLAPGGFHMRVGGGSGNAIIHLDEVRRSGA